MSLRCISATYLFLERDFDSLQPTLKQTGRQLPTSCGAILLRSDASDLVKSRLSKATGARALRLPNSGISSSFLLPARLYPSCKNAFVLGLHTAGWLLVPGFMTFFKDEAELREYIQRINPNYRDYAVALWKNGVNSTSQLGNASISTLTASGITSAIHAEDIKESSKNTGKCPDIAAVHLCHCQSTSLFQTL